MHNPLTGKTVFVQMAAYRDPQLKGTLKDLFAKADEPENLSVCVCWQHDDKDEWDDLDDYKDNLNVNILDYKASESKGACWARHKIQQEYNGEDFTLQLDSHHRFIKGWDTELKNMYYGLQLDGYEKPLITAYIPGYDDKTGKPIDSEPWRLYYNYFGHDGPLHTMPETIPDYKKLTGPVPSRFFSAHWAFADGDFSKNVQHDPKMYFHGEEITLAVRAFTHGYDLFHPHKTLAWHHYGRKDNPKHWDDDTTYNDYNSVSYERVRKLLGIGGEKFKNDFNYKYGFGTERTLEEYERYAGIRFSDKGVQQYTLDRKYPSNPEYKNKKLYNQSFTHPFKYCVNVYREHLKENDYICFAFAFKDKDGNDLHRQDVVESELPDLLKGTDDWIKLWREFDTIDKPHSWLVWPNSKKKGWCDPITGII